MQLEYFKEHILNIKPENFEDLALEIFRFQLENNTIYKQFVKNLGVNISNIKKLEQIPCLPIEFFKFYSVRSIQEPHQVIFESSGTTQTSKSKHYLTDTNFYTQNSIRLFEQAYGSLENYHILALLPSYLEQGASSLVFMIERFIEASKSEYAGFYLYDYEKLFKTIETIRKQNNRKILLVGVTFALLDLAENSHIDLSDVILMETGGMKGRRKEMIREEIHEILQNKLQVKAVHSEYGMTELISQAYSKGQGIFEMPATMRILLREVNDPLTYTQKRGVINVIDLANIETCAFIATQDLGTILENNQFMILGRSDNTEQRGCNLMIQ